MAEVADAPAPLRRSGESRSLASLGMTQRGEELGMTRK
jgi:hypothetical protein